MKRYTGILLAALAVIALSAACNKETSVDGSPAAETVSITATLSDVLTKVDFTPSYTDGKPAGIALTWPPCPWPPASGPTSTENRSK